MKKVLVGIMRLFGKNARRTGIGLLQILEEYPDQKGTTMWQRVVQTIIEIAQIRNRSSILQTQSQELFATALKPRLEFWQR